ncbi:MAG: molybdopterin-guanine dinucleotide biosynthesis protein B [Desulfotignum sp.]
MAPSIISIAGKSNSGKTTFLEKLIAELTGKRYRIGSAKHTHEGFDLDNKGKDSWRHKNAGASATLVVTDEKIAMVKDDLGTDIEKMQFYLSDMDLILAEGFKRQPLPKIEVFRADGPHVHPLCLDSPDLIAFVTDAAFAPKVPVFRLEDVAGVASFIEKQYLEYP